MATERTRGAKGAARTELVAVRFDPKTKYLMELAARVQRRSVANYVERAVEESLKTVTLQRPGADEQAGYPPSVATIGESLWDVDEADRFFRLADNYPHLMTHDEQVLWKLVNEVWELLRDGKTQTLYGNQAGMELMRANWQLFKDAAEGQVVASAVADVIKGNRRESAVSGAAHFMRGMKAAQAESEAKPATPAKKPRKIG